MQGSTYDERLTRNWNWCVAYFDRKTKQLKIEGWQLKMGNMKTALGMCYHGKNIIKVSSHFLRGPTCTEAKMRNTILHELAHVIAGPKNGHNQIWKNIALHIGCDGSICNTMDLPEAKYLAHCEKKCFKQTYFRKPKLENKVCGICRKPLTLIKLR